jgi:hypothetical protein
MKLLIKQEHATFYMKDKVTTELLYGGAAGGGKTAYGCLWLIEGCQNYAGSRWLMGRSKLKALKETTLNTFFEVASDLKINDQFTFNAQSNIIYFKNGSEILLKDLFLYPSDPLFDSLGSLEITGAFIDECNQITFKAWQTVKSRIRYKLDEFNLIPKLLGSCNPAKNWTYKEFYKPSITKTLKDYRKFIQALPTDNPHLPPSYLESLLQLDKNSRERLYYGNWEYDDDPSTLIDQDAITDYFNPVHLLPTGKKYITIDVARKGRDKSVIRVWFGWLCIEVIEIDKNTITELAAIVRTLQAKHAISNSHTVADEDGVGGGLVDVLRCDGFVNNSKALNGENYENLKSQCSVSMAQKIQARQVGETNTQGITRDIIGEEMEQIKLKDIDKDGRIGIVSKDVIKANIGRSPDHWDSIMMRYYFELKPRISKPTSRLI